VLLRGPAEQAQSADAERKVAKYERWLQQAQAKEAAALSLLEERTAAFTRDMMEFERRHGTLKAILDDLMGPEGRTQTALVEDGAAVLVNAAVEEADARQSRPGAEITGTVEVAGFRAQIDKLRAQQAAFLDAAEEQAVDRAEQIRGVISLTGISMARLMESSETGGPLLEVEAEGADLFASAEVDDPFARRVQEVQRRLDEARQFEELIRAVPLGAPVSAPFRETSGFGNRYDPFTRRPAWHNGLDLAAYHRAPIVATAPGKVIFAGYRGDYGRVVRIDHGSGFETRYAHLSSIDVKEGDEVAIGQVVGKMGSTGRSTGTHLHYEVYYHGKAYNPIKFLRAGRHVHQG
jgi:murein DD-endopeptidase MepM/ murein hydrolase activator NlpD